MPLPRVHRVVQDSLGNVVPQVLCSVLLEGTGTLATLWQDDAGTIPLSNPMTSDATYGSFDFYVTPGHFDLTFTKPGYVFQPLLDMQVPQDDLTLGTMAQQDASAVAITGGTVSATFVQSAQGFYAPQNAANDKSALLSGMDAGGTNRWGVNCTGSALNYLRGDTGIGGVPVAPSKLTLRYDKSTQHGLIVQSNNGNSPFLAVDFKNAAGGDVGSIEVTATATAYNTSSDARLKHAITPLTGALDVVAALKAVHFLWNANDEPGEGFLAHELMRQVPAAVTGEPDAVNADGSVKPQQVDHSRLVPWLTAALQEALAQLAALAARVQSLEEQLGV